MDVPETIDIGRTISDLQKAPPPPREAKPATKPRDPAFERALSVRSIRIGLRYLGD
jgi:hypothetical protein